MRRFLSVLVAAFMLLTMPITTGISRTLAEGTTEPTEQAEPSEGIVLETEDIDPATLHVHKLGEGAETRQLIKAKTTQNRPMRSRAWPHRF